MRPLRIDLHGFTVFREPTTVDLTDADFFALVGPTGSGKSTILDAVCFALYGTVPRWGHRNRIEYALAPSATEARVRLVFEASGARFVATRVLRRDGKGKVTTAHAGLEQLPHRFDLSTFDTAPAARETELGTVLAGTPAEMDAAVQAAVGLPYEQFVSCVVLPQGEFAKFLHSKPAERQEILVNLLGLHVYQRIGERARTEERRAEAAAAATRSVLADLSDVDDAALAAATAARDAAERLASDVEEALPGLARAEERATAARTELTTIDGQVATLRSVRAPAGAAALAATVAAARQAAADAADAVARAEEHEEKLRAELAAAGDAVELKRLLDGYADRQRLRTEAQKLGELVVSARTEHEHAAEALEAAQAAAERAAAAVDAAQHGVERAQTMDRAASLRPHLVKGEPCPVCTQPVAKVPAMPEAPALRTARQAYEKAQRAAEAANRNAAECDKALRNLDRALAAAAAQHDQLAQRLSTVEEQLAGAPPAKTVTAQLEAIAKADRALGKATEALRSARTVGRSAAAEAKRADDRLRDSWRDFDKVRDGLATFGPPAADRDDLARAWSSLAAWANKVLDERVTGRSQVAGALAQAEAEAGAVRERIAALFTAAGQRSPAQGYQQAAALAVERAVGAYRRIVERRDQAERLADQVAAHEREAQVARALALHLRADRFERWLLTEALDALVAGASRTLRELSGGQYDLIQEKGEFHVVDHSDAGLRRAVRTLSGGETFQASLALALALSEQLAGLSSAAASLESIMLDEGFGTLDPATLDTVAATLENLAARGDRMVGVVTHVSALAERMPVRFEVRRDAAGTARVERMG